jgi:hypothetical protein
MPTRPLAALAVTLLTGACSSAISKAPVQGTASDVSQLVGEWQGDYNGGATGRRGLIAFRLRAGADTAEGDVIMQSRGLNDPAIPDAAAVPWESLRTDRQPLSIRFVFVSAGQVSGVLDPYRDPDCGCTLTTTFRGTLRGDVIEGTYHSEGESISHIPQDGQWRVKRVKP